MEEAVNSRNKIQETAMQLLYSFLIKEQYNQEINFEESISLFLEKPYEDCDLYLKELLINSLKHQKEIIEDLSKHLRNWTFDRLNDCIKAILILACANYKYCGLNEKAVVINIAVKLTKKYCEKNDYKFVNGILDNCLNDK